MVHSGRKAAKAAAALNRSLLVVVIGSEYNHKGTKNTKKHEARLCDLRTLDVFVVKCARRGC